MISSPNNPKVTALSRRLALALRSSQATLSSLDPGDAVATWDELVSILDFCSVSLSELNPLLPTDIRLLAIGGCHEATLTVHLATAKLRRWGEQRRRTLAAQTAVPEERDHAN